MSSRPNADRPRGFTYQMGMQIPANTTSDDPEEQTLTIPFDSRTEEITIGWSDNNWLAGVRLETAGGEALLPRNRAGGTDDYLAGSNYTAPFPVATEFDEGDEIVAAFVNLDSTNAHTINVHIPLWDQD